MAGQGKINHRSRLVPLYAKVNRDQKEYGMKPFSLGSTLIVVIQPNLFDWDPGLLVATVVRVLP
jgi:hypothetical protein